MKLNKPKQTQGDQIEQIPTADLIPYARNSRTHSDEQVAQIAASIREFGFCNPVLIDAQNTIIAGHGRVLAAGRMKLETVPCLRLDSCPKSVRRNGVKDCLCQDCGAEFTVRKDTSPVVCRRCASSRGGRTKQPLRAEYMQCASCETQFRKSLGQTYCSKQCRRNHKRVSRTCKKCSATFHVLRSSLESGTNASGNFCGRACYENWMCNTKRTTGRGSQWSRRSKEVIRQQPFCAVCGTCRSLQVHHIVPFRMTHDNSRSNLVALCVKHHKVVECLTVEIENTGSDVGTMKIILGSIISERLMATVSILRSIHAAT